MEIVPFQKGHKFYPGTKLFVKGQIPWNKNKTYHNFSEAGENHYTKKPGFIHHRKGKKLSKKHYEALKKSGLWDKGKIAWNKGKESAPETIEKLRQSHLGQVAWNKGKGNGRQYKYYPYVFNEQLKEKVRVRDNFTCQICEVPELECKNILSIHHIDYDVNNSSMDNLISLCRKCHAMTNINRVFWTRWFKEDWHKEIIDFMGRQGDIMPVRWR